MSLERASGTSDDSPSLSTELQAEVKPELTSDLDADHLAYYCAQCNERCINPVDHRLTCSRVCINCYVSYLSSRR